jgi:hypothetical protein
VKLDVLTKVAALLREKKASKESSLLRGVWKASTDAAEAAGKSLHGKGHGIMGTAVKYTPHAAAAYGAKKGYESEPVQNAIYKYKVWKANKDAQSGYGS